MEVDIDDPVPFRQIVFHVEEGPHRVDTGIVHQHINVTEKGATSTARRTACRWLTSHSTNKCSPPTSRSLRTAAARYSSAISKTATFAPREASSRRCRSLCRCSPGDDYALPRDP